MCFDSGEQEISFYEKTLQQSTLVLNLNNLMLKQHIYYITLGTENIKPVFFFPIEISKI